MKLKKLIKDLPVHVKGSKELEIRGLCSDSRRCKIGDLFFAKRGAQFDGTRFISDALAGGAVAIVTDLHDPFSNATQIITPDVAALEIEFAKRFYNNPADKLTMVGITGTNGKTTTSYLVRHILGNCSLIGTIEAIIGKHHFPAQLTTPDIIALQKLLSDMVDAKSKACVMEVSSHALHQRRVANINYDIAIFTQLTQDHLDYHHTIENYFAAKAKLFKTLAPKALAVLNADCPYHKHIKTKARIMTYGIDNPADLRAFDIETSPEHIAFSLVHGKQSARLKCPLIGRFNIYNCLAAICTALECNMSLHAIARSLETFSHVQGRLERIPNSRGLHIFVDFAHTADALQSVIETLRPLSDKRLLTLFGCGGDRDQDKRPQMGEIASKNSDHVMITSDNPRTEDPKAICDAIAKGCEKGNYTIVSDRKKAITKLLEMAKPGDILLIAGKGHERTQTFGDKSYPFDDRSIVTQALAQDSEITV